MSDAQNKSEKTGNNLGKCQRIKEGMVSRLDFLTGAQTKSGKATPSAKELKRANTAVVVANFTENLPTDFQSSVAKCSVLFNKADITTIVN